MFRKLDSQTKVALWDFSQLDKQQQLIDNDQMLVAQIQVPPKGK